VNEKIEGFFHLCKRNRLGLYGQAVIIPYSDVDDLVLSEEVVKAVNEQKFFIYPIKTVDEGLEILTSVRPGKLLKGDKEEIFEVGSVNWLVLYIQSYLSLVFKTKLIFLMFKF